MNPRVAHLALVIVALGSGAFVVALVLCALLYGCAATLPPEPPFVETVSSRDH